MREDFLHYLWKHKKLDVAKLQTTTNEPVEIVSVGQHNHHAGPDFFNAQLRIGYQLWAGNVEIHVKSSDWFVHNHEVDAAYDNVILHVVWEHDTEIFRQDNTAIPTLELKRFVSEKALKQYQKLFAQNDQWINCETELPTLDDFTIQNWLERLFFERLEHKSAVIEQQLNASNNNWEAVLFTMLTKNFGLKVNGDAFLSLANTIDFSIVRKTQHDILSLEALLFGQAGLLDNEVQEPYSVHLKKEYGFLKHKFELSNDQVLPLQFFRLRPSNFPTVRLSQLAQLYYTHHTLFSKVIDIDCVAGYYDLFQVSATDFWATHYTFSKASKRTSKRLTKTFIDLLLINTIIPLKFSYAKHLGNLDEQAVVKLTKSIRPERNSIVDTFHQIKPMATSVIQSQALLELKRNYCDKNKCLQCAIGHQLLTINS